MSKILVYCLGALTAAILPVSAGDSVDAFAKHVEETKSMDASVRRAVLDELKLADTPAKRASAIPRGLARIYPDYGAGLSALGNGQTRDALATFLKLMRGPEAGKDPFLAAHARLDAARIGFAEGDYQGALRHVEEINADRRDAIADRSDLDYLRIACEAKLLRRDQALKHAEAFLSDYPNASPVLRKPVGQLASLLRGTKEGSLTDVRDHMVAAGSYLVGQDTSPAQATSLQNKVEKMLTRIIGDGEEEKAGSEPDKAQDKQDESEKPSAQQGRNNEKEKPGAPQGHERQSQRLEAKEKQKKDQRDQKQQQQSGQQQSGQQQSGQQQSGQQQPGQQQPGQRQSLNPGLAQGIEQSPKVGASDSALVEGNFGGPAGDGVDVSRAAGERWGSMPPKERDKVLSVVSASFPEAYRDLIEQYYRGLMDGGWSEGAESRR
jgi:tetratricopeptide (TPR) repeat protein